MGLGRTAILWCVPTGGTPFKPPKCAEGFTEGTRLVLPRNNPATTSRPARAFV